LLEDTIVFDIIFLLSAETGDRPRSEIHIVADNPGTPGNS
jgi:hypothetical protein